MTLTLGTGSAVPFGRRCSRYAVVHVCIAVLCSLIGPSERNSRHTPIEQRRPWIQCGLMSLLVVPAFAADDPVDGCEEQTDVLFDGDPDLKQLERNVTRGEDIDIKEQGSDFVISYNALDVLALQNACDNNPDAMMIGTDYKAIDCVSSFGANVRVEFNNAFACISVHCTGDDLYTADDLLVDIAQEQLSMSCTVPHDTDTDTPAPSPIQQARWEQCENGAQQLLLQHPNLEQEETALEADMELQPTDTGFLLGFPDEDIQQFRSACDTAGGLLQGVHLEDFDCVIEGSSMTVTFQNLYDCFPPGCDDYPVEQALISIWESLDMDCTVESPSDTPNDGENDNDGTPTPTESNAPSTIAPSEPPDTVSSLPTIDVNDQQSSPPSAVSVPIDTLVPTVPVDDIQAPTDTSDPTVQPTPTDENYANDATTPFPTIAPFVATPQPTPLPESPPKRLPSPVDERLPTFNDAGSNQPQPSSSSSSSSSSQKDFDWTTLPPTAMYAVAGFGAFILALTCMSLRRQQRRNEARPMYQMTQLNLHDEDDEEDGRPIM